MGRLTPVGHAGELTASQSRLVHRTMHDLLSLVSASPLGPMMLPRCLLAADDALLYPARLVRGDKGHVHLYLGEQSLPAHFPEAVVIGRSHPHCPAVYSRWDEEIPGAAGLVTGRGDVDSMADHVVQGEGDLLGGPGEEGP